MFLEDEFRMTESKREWQRERLSAQFLSCRGTFSLPAVKRFELNGPAIRSYNDGWRRSARIRPAYWNGDGTNLPAKFAVEYFCGRACQQNKSPPATIFRNCGEDVSLIGCDKLP